MKFCAVLLVLVCFEGAFGILPTSITKCKRDDPQISDCIARAIEAIKPKLVTGDLGDGFIVPSLEPFLTGDMAFGEEKGLNIQLNNVYATGTSQFKIEKLRANIKDAKFDFLIEIPKLDIFGKYKMNFNFFGTITQSQGDYHSQLKGAKLRISFKGYRYMKNGKEYIKFEPFTIKFDRGTVVKLEISNLFGGNKVLADIVHSLILSNQDFVLKNSYPHLEAKLSKVFTEISNKIVENASYDELFPV